MIAIEAYRARVGCFLSRPRAIKNKFQSKTKLNDDADAQSKFCYTEFFQVCIMFLFIVTLRWNINMAFLKLSLLLISGDIESNPGPPTREILKTVSGNFNQGHLKFGATAGIQCACNALYAICFSIVKKVSIWKSFDLDYILENGDETFKTVGISRAMELNELPRNLTIENCSVTVEFLDNQFGLLGYGNLFDGHTSCDTGNGLIFTTCGFCFSLIWSKNCIFLFDSHSRDQNGHFVDDSFSVLLSFQTLSHVERFIRNVYSKQLQAFSETQYQIQYIRVSTNKNPSTILDSINRHRKRVTNKISFDRMCTARHDEIKSQKREKRASLLGTPEHDKLKMQKHEKRAALFGTPEHNNSLKFLIHAKQ